MAEQRWLVQHQPRVAIRAAPSTSAPIIGVAKTGVGVASLGPPKDNWIQLAPASRPGGAAAAWMMVDGAQVGLGVLLQRQLTVPAPRVAFAGSRAVVVAWDALAGDDAALTLELHAGEAGSGLALRPPEALGAGAGQRRVGGLQPASTLSLRLCAVLPDGSRAHSAWVPATTRAAPSPAELPPRRSVVGAEGGAQLASADVFGRLRGRALQTSGGRADCPSGLWMPAELLHGGLNAAVANFRCGDCALAPAQHQDFGPATQPPPAPAAAAAVEPEPEPEPERSREEYLAEFNRWDAQRPSWTHLYRSAAQGEGEAEGGVEISAVLATSDIHIDFPDNQSWLDALRRPSQPSALLLAGDVCTSIPKMRAAFTKLVSIYAHVFYVPGNHELWTAKAEPNSIQKFLNILRYV